MMKKELLLQDSFFSFLYPEYCLHCEEKLEGKERLFCSYCWPFLEFAKEKVSLFFEKGKGRIFFAYVFEAGILSSLLLQELRQNRFLQEDIASFFLYQIASVFQEKMDLILLVKEGAYALCLEKIGKKLAFFIGVPFLKISSKKKRLEAYVQGKNVLIPTLTGGEEEIQEIREKLKPFCYKSLFFLSFLEKEKLSV